MQKGKTLYTRTMGVDIPHPFAKPKKRGRKPVQGPPPPPKKIGRPPKQKKIVKPPKKIKLPTGRAMDEAIIKIQQQMLLDKKKIRKMNNGGYTVTNRFSKRMLPNKKRTTRIT